MPRHRISIFCDVAHVQCTLKRWEVTTTTIRLVRSPMWALIIDGAHKKATWGAPDITRGRYIDMKMGALHTRHLGLIVPQTTDFLHSTKPTSAPATRLKENTRGPKRLYDRWLSSWTSCSRTLLTPPLCLSCSLNWLSLQRMVPAQWLESIKASQQSSEKRGQGGGCCCNS